MSRRPPPSFRAIAPPSEADAAREAEEEARLEALARRRGVARLETEPKTAPKTEPAAEPASALPVHAEPAPGSNPEPISEPALEPVVDTSSRPVARRARTPSAPLSAEGQTAAPEPTPEPEPQRALNIELPVSVIRALKAQAVAEDCSVRHLVMRALSQAGVTIPAAAMVPDGRRRPR